MDLFHEGLSFLHQKFDLQAGDVVEVTLDAPANVMLLDPDNFSKYKQNISYRYHGVMRRRVQFDCQPRVPGRGMRSSTSVDILGGFGPAAGYFAIRRSLRSHDRQENP